MRKKIIASITIFVFLVTSIISLNVISFAKSTNVVLEGINGFNFTTDANGVNAVFTEGFTNVSTADKAIATSSKIDLTDFYITFKANALTDAAWISPQFVTKKTLFQVNDLAVSEGIVPLFNTNWWSKTDFAIQMKMQSANHNFNDAINCRSGAVGEYGGNVIVSGAITNQTPVTIAMKKVGDKYNYMVNGDISYVFDVADIESVFGGTTAYFVLGANGGIDLSVSDVNGMVPIKTTNNLSLEGINGFNFTADANGVNAVFTEGFTNVSTADKAIATSSKIDLTDFSITFKANALTDAAWISPQFVTKKTLFQVNDLAVSEGIVPLFNTNWWSKTDFAIQMRMQSANHDFNDAINCRSGAAGEYGGNVIVSGAITNQTPVTIAMKKVGDKYNYMINGDVSYIFDVTDIETIFGGTSAYFVLGANGGIDLNITDINGLIPTKYNKPVSLEGLNELKANNIANGIDVVFNGGFANNGLDKALATTEKIDLTDFSITFKTTSIDASWFSPQFATKKTLFVVDDNDVSSGIVPLYNTNWWSKTDFAVQMRLQSPNNSFNDAINCRAGAVGEYAGNVIVSGAITNYSYVTIAMKKIGDKYNYIINGDISYEFNAADIENIFGGTTAYFVLGVNGNAEFNIVDVNGEIPVAVDLGNNSSSESNSDSSSDSSSTSSGSIDPNDANLDFESLPGWLIVSSKKNGAPQITKTDFGFETSFVGNYNSSKDAQALIYQTPGSPENFSVELTINDAPNGNVWFSPTLLSSGSKYFDVGGVNDTQGLVPLMTPWSTSITVDMRKNISGFPNVFTTAAKANQDGTGTNFALTFGTIKGQHFKFDLKKVDDDNPAGPYVYSVNDIEAYRFTQDEINAMFPDGKVYLGLGYYTNVKDLTATITLTKINDKSFAPETGPKPDWLVLPGADIDGTLVPATVNSDDNGYHIFFNAPYLSDGKDQAVVYNNTVNITNCSITFGVDEIPNTEGDWLSPALLNKATFFSVNDSNRSSGIIPLIYMKSDKIVMELHSQSLSKGFSDGFIETIASDEYTEVSNNIKYFVLKNTPAKGSMINIRILKNLDYYDYFVNGILAFKIPSKFMNEAFADGTAYFAFGSNVTNGGNINITVKNVDGNHISKLTITDYLQKYEAINQNDDNSPNTSDEFPKYLLSLIVLVLLTFTLTIKRKKVQQK